MLATRFAGVSAAGLFVALGSVAAMAQQFVVQQPEFRQLAVPTTVVVPDRGAAHLGGVGGAGQTQAVVGPVPLARSTTGSAGSSSVHVRAYVHDFQAMDEALLGTAPETRPESEPRARPARSPLHGLPRAGSDDKTRPLAHVRADVEAALRKEADAVGSNDHAAAIQQLVELHQRIKADPRHATNVSVRGLGRRVALRLADTHHKLVSGAAAGGGVEAQQLIDLIQTTIGPEVWDVNGGQGTIAYFANGHALVIAAPDNVHTDLAGLLERLR